nr:YejG family protein [Dickeya dianthicola]
MRKTAVNTLQLSVVHRLPQSYRWLSGFTGIKVEPIPLCSMDDDSYLIGFKLLSHDGEEARQIMRHLNQSLDEIQLQCAIVEWEGESCLFLHRQDESAAMCRLKDVGVAIAESVCAQYPF